MSEITLRLRDGSEAVVRPIRADDKEGLAEALAGMSERSRYQRFLAPVTEFSASQLRYLTEVDHHAHEALVALDPASRAGVGVGRFVRLEDARSAEAAVAVVDEWQGRGLGTALCALIADRAREEGIERFTAVLLAQNRQMLDLFSALGHVREVSRQASTVEIEVELPEQGIGEHMAEVLRVAAGGAVELATPPWGEPEVES
jgi:RimJ/RimL family protein N-acetyltransferase